MNSHRAVYNGKRNMSRSNSGGGSPGSMTPEPSSPSPPHDESVRFLAEAWQRVYHEYEIAARNGRADGPVVYQEKHIALQGFEAFDLEQWFGLRNAQKLQSS